MCATPVGCVWAESLDVDEQVTLKDIVALFVLLGRLLGDLLITTGTGQYTDQAQDREESRNDTCVFPAEGGAALDAVDISDGVLAGGHGSFAGLAFDNVYPG